MPTPVPRTLGEAPEATILVEDVAQARTVEVPDPERVSYLTQTTLAVDETAEVVLVVGSDNSSNSRRLVELARETATETVHFTLPLAVRAS